MSPQFNKPAKKAIHKPTGREIYIATNMKTTAVSTDPTEDVLKLPFDHVSYYWFDQEHDKWEMGHCHKSEIDYAVSN